MAQYVMPHMSPSTRFLNWVPQQSMQFGSLIAYDQQCTPDAHYTSKTMQALYEAPNQPPMLRLLFATCN